VRDRPGLPERPVTDLVVLSLEAWDGVWRRNQHLMAGLLCEDPRLRVLFVEPATDPLHAITSHSRPRIGRGLRPVTEGQGVDEARLWLYEPTKVFPRRIDRQVDARWARGIRHTAKRLGFIDPLLWINDPAGANLLTQTVWRALYDITDDWLEADRTSPEHDRLVRDETVILEQCREVVVCSPALVVAKSSTRPVTLIPNAVDVAAYRTPAPRPTDLPDGPVAVYLGTIHTDRIDLDLCEATATGVRGHGHLVLVGPALLSPPDRERLIRAGVVLLGAKAHTAVPGYLQHADVLVVPHVVTPFTNSLDPIKLYEYRAVGRPVVSTPVAGFRERSDDPLITIADGAGFVEAVGCALPASTAFPAGVGGDDVPTWDERVMEMGEVIDRLRASAPGGAP
jgi:teichuronic acid biosynthesis glycosyltransferase TuaH